MKLLKRTTRLDGLRLFVACIVSIMLLSMLSCNGGGGGDNPLSPESSDPAVISESNAVQLTADTLFSVYETPSLDALSAVSVNDTTQAAGIMEMEDFARAFVRRIQASSNLSASSVPASASAIVTLPTEQGSCGGTETISISYDEQGYFSGTVTADGFCNDGVTESGTATISGRINPETEDIISITGTFNTYTITGGDESFSLNGTMYVTFPSEDSMNIVFNLTEKDGVSGETCRLENLVLGLTDNNTDGYSLATISGRVDQSAYGYVDLSTVTAVKIFFWEEYPCEGVVTATGAQGAAGGNTKACLTAHDDSATFHVEADTDGDGIYDWNSGTLNWSDYEE